MNKPTIGAHRVQHAELTHTVEAYHTRANVEVSVSANGTVLKLKRGMTIVTVDLTSEGPALDIWKSGERVKVAFDHDLSIRTTGTLTLEGMNVEMTADSVSVLGNLGVTVNSGALGKIELRQGTVSINNGALEVT